ncbi:MAG: hypothetical protein E4H01_09685 [Lysobacterales bacterium]|nr:MAG: hypothetical protein E4H01_09685 [Xanthomonadales bacterium]
MESRREIEQRQRDSKEQHGVRSTGKPRQVDRLRVGCAALRAWLDASQPREPGRVIGAAKITLLVATIATVWAAFAIHLAFLLLLVVVVGPVSFAMERGRDGEWHRIGAKRRFQGSGLADPVEWSDESVRERITELETLLVNAHRPSARLHGDAYRGSALDTQVEEHVVAEDDAQFASDLAAAGLTIEDTRGDRGEWLRLVARADRSRESLECVKNEGMRLRAEAAEHRDHLLRYLQSRGVRPTRLPDTAAAIAEGLGHLTEAP